MVTVFSGSRGDIDGFGYRVILGKESGAGYNFEGGGLFDLFQILNTYGSLFL